MAETAQNLTEGLSVSEAVVKKDASEISTDTEITSDGKNVKQIKCQRCPSTILIPGMATLVTSEFVLPDGHLKEENDPKSVDNMNKYWRVDNMYSFENVGFSKTVDGVKYLICADCEIGPIGYHDLNTKLSYVSLCKITYC
ncbi:guanine nucleotide exchange factor MSS4-like [Stegodyphus dumicola]|uniref:guanine nucleotide exchange factor MSS4-like n=1 Tax=Stegodyphus dumicola TaxID=202533 RepID=UPI0015AF3531|nr:guanine nucleotide exchange factor MSS4-like [Stegodyphus dumicola]XP_035234104.1 guanine nucleotide exchange factor MSS4-like [Stegodyphus dumicola]XP_035234105.1 guanine nucleotide exchange factor MSS4-like [Stegodyphus dumicola]